MHNYFLVRKKTKRMYLRIKGDRVYVTAPFHVSKEYIDTFVEENEDWILKQLSRQVHMETGCCIRILSNVYRVKMIESGRTFIQGDTIFVLNSEAEFQSFCLGIAKEYIYNRFYEISDQLGLNGLDLKIRFYKSRWGSCIPAKKQVALNANLIFTSEDCIDAIIYHELAHLYVQNHSRNFYNIVLSWYPSYYEVHKKLKEFRPYVFDV